VSADLLHALLAYAEVAGVDARPALRDCGLEAARTDPEERVEGVAFGALLESLARASGDLSFGLRFGVWSSQRAGGVVSAIAANAPTVGEALERLVRFHAIVADALAPMLVRGRGHAAVRLGSPAGPQVAEAAIAVLVGAVRRACGGSPDIDVRFRHQGAPGGDHERLLGARVRFDAAADEVRFPAAALSTPLPLADSRLLAVLERHGASRLASVGDRTFAGRVRRTTHESLLRSGACPPLAEAARALACRPRTVQARLAAEGTCYREVVDEVRRTLAEQHLLDRDLTLAEVAFVVGFADQAAFTNAFRRWTGATPGAFRSGARARR
jgi:AraC-like DNA-binding protein